MRATLGGMIAARWSRDAFGVPTFLVHQTDYPEIEAAGRTTADACKNLVRLLAEALDFAGDAWRQQPLEEALADARAFAGY